MALNLLKFKILKLVTGTKKSRFHSIMNEIAEAGESSVVHRLRFISGARDNGTLLFCKTWTDRLERRK